MKFICTIPAILLILLTACSEDENKSSDQEDGTQGDVSQFEAKPMVTDTLFKVAFADTEYDVEIKTPDGIVNGVILVLQGWNFTITDWCEKTKLCEEALSKGYILVFPEMGKSIYSEEHYEETILEWKKYPTRKWLRDSVIGKLQADYGLFEEEGNNYVMGLSTGGRGALLLALDLPGIFSGCATLSGDYDQFMFPNDNLYIGYFGKMKAFEKRWQGFENPRQIMLAKNLHVPLYMGHGMMDDVVPYKHFTLMKEFIEFTKPDVKVEYHTDTTAQHDYTYWSSEVANVLDFFEKN
ncbi:MAG: prolyl oligopeptidase family serine peptidase [Crocinitomicaceae bacterium]|nr:prolyl oligopeptidase family serine peptidase [Crocinitomicaceae bacterium]